MQLYLESSVAELTFRQILIENSYCHKIPRKIKILFRYGLKMPTLIWKFASLEMHHHTALLRKAFASLCCLSLKQKGGWYSLTWQFTSPPSLQWFLPLHRFFVYRGNSMSIVACIQLFQVILSSLP